MALGRPKSQEGGRKIIYFVHVWSMEQETEENKKKMESINQRLHILYTIFLEFLLFGKQHVIFNMEVFSRRANGVMDQHRDLQS